MQLGEYQEPTNIHAIALDEVQLGASIAEITSKAKLLLFSVDTICRGTLIHAIIGTITPSDFKLIADRSGGDIFSNLLLQFPDLLKSN